MHQKSSRSLATIPSCRRASCPGVPKSLALPIRMCQATLSPGVCTVPGAGPISCNQARLPPGVALPYAYTYQATLPNGCKNQARLSPGPGPQNLLHFHAHVKLPSYSVTSAIHQATFSLHAILQSSQAYAFALQIKLLSRKVASFVQVGRKLASWLPS